MRPVSHLSPLYNFCYGIGLAPCQENFCQLFGFSSPKRCVLFRPGLKAFLNAYLIRWSFPYDFLLSCLGSMPTGNLRSKSVFDRNEASLQKLIYLAARIPEIVCAFCWRKFLEGKGRPSNFCKSKKGKKGRKRAFF